jgi:NADH:quinone reductase (non-electrogenic)
MCVKEAEIHDNVKEVMVKSDERDTIHIFRTLRNTARVYKNKVAVEVVEKEKAGCKFEDIRHLVSGERGRQVYVKGDIDAGIWTCGISVGLIHDIPSCDELVQRLGKEAEDYIHKLASLSANKSSSQSGREARL